MGGEVPVAGSRRDDIPHWRPPPSSTKKQSQEGQRQDQRPRQDRRQAGSAACDDNNGGVDEFDSPEWLRRQQREEPPLADFLDAEVERLKRVFLSEMAAAAAVKSEAERAERAAWDRQEKDLAAVARRDREVAHRSLGNGRWNNCVNTSSTATGGGGGGAGAGAGAGAAASLLDDGIGRGRVQPTPASAAVSASTSTSASAATLEEMKLGSRFLVRGRATRGPGTARSQAHSVWLSSDLAKLQWRVCRVNDTNPKPDGWIFVDALTEVAQKRKKSDSSSSPGAVVLYLCTETRRLVLEEMVRGTAAVWAEALNQLRGGSGPSAAARK